MNSGRASQVEMNPIGPIHPVDKVLGRRERKGPKGSDRFLCYAAGAQRPLGGLETARFRRGWIGLHRRGSPL